MALTRRAGSAEWAFGLTGVTIDGITSVTSFTARKEYTITVEAKDQDGEIAAVLEGGEKYTIEAEGYADATNPPDLGGAITAGGLTGKITGSEVIGSNEDFQKVRITGTGYKAIEGGGA
jgi:hypothetical protein